MEHLHGEWLGLVIYDANHSCAHCRKQVSAHNLAVANEDGDKYHFNCATLHGWVPSDTEAWTLALYNQPEAGAVVH